MECMERRKTMQTVTYRLRVAESLHRLIGDAAANVASYGIDANEIVRRTARMVNRLSYDVVQKQMSGFVPQNNGACGRVKKETKTVTLQVRECQKPQCSATQFRQVLEWRCRKALEAPKTEPFVTSRKAGVDYVVVDGG